MKKLFLIMLLIVALASLLLSACSQSAPTPAPTTKAQTTTSAPATTSAPSTSVPATTSAPATSSTSTSAGAVIKIGHIRPLTGDQAMVSPRMVKGFDLAFDQIGYQIAGKQIQIIVGDSKGDPSTAIDVARKMVENDHVSMIVGPTISGEELAVANYMNQVGIPHIIPTQMTMQMIPNNKWTICTDGSQAEYTTSMAVYTYDQLGYKKVDTITQDNGAGRSFLTPFINTYKSKGGQIVQETYTTYPAPDFAPYFSALKDADALAAWTSGGDAIKFLSQYNGMGLKKRLPLVGAFNGGFIVPFILNALPTDVADSTVGDLVPSGYSPLLDTPVNKKFVAAWQAKYNEIPGDDSITAPYQGGLAIIEALKATNGDTTPEKLRQALLNVNFESPQGPVKIDPKVQAGIQNIYICKMDKQANGYVYVPVYTFKDVPTQGY